MNLPDLPLLPELIVLRRELHADPELAFQETRTAERVARELERYGLEVHRGLAQTGVVGLLRAGTGTRAIALRADMDALPITEQNSFAHAARFPERMHACGHDGHTAMLLGAARHLAARPDFDGMVVFIFQPAEEAEGGGKRMIDEGLFRRFPVEAVYGMHNWPDLPVGEIAARSGPVMAGTCRFEITLSGRGGHAAMPHHAADVIVAAGHLVCALQTVVARRIHPAEAAVVSITQIHAGNAWNILPDAAVLRGTIRAFRIGTQEKIEATIQQLANGIAAAHSATAETRFVRCYPPTVNTEAETALCLEAARDILGTDRVREQEHPSLAAEDFAFMLQERPGCYIWLGSGDPRAPGAPLHSPHYDFNDAALPIGVAYWARLVQRILGKG